ARTAKLPQPAKQIDLETNPAQLPVRAATWLRLCPSQRRPRHMGATGLARSQEHPAHGALHRTVAASVQGLLALTNARDFAERDVMECPESASPYRDIRRFDDRCPTSNLAFYQCCEWLLASPLFARNVAAEVGEALA